MTTKAPTPASQEAVAATAAALARGELVILPTETVYGLGADATNPQAVARIYTAKGRPDFNPLIVHVADAATAGRYVTLNAAAQKLAAAFWPGPFTLVLPLKPGNGIAPAVTAGLDTLAVRVPAHPMARAVLTQFGGPVAAPSANKSGRLSPTTAAHAAAELGDSVAIVLDGGACQKGVESTIVAVSDTAIELLRPGSVTPADIEAVTGLPVIGSGPSPADRPTAPGQLESHYAPRAALRLNATTADDDEALLAFGPDAPQSAANLSHNGDLEQAAANLFAMLYHLDQTGVARIAVMPIPNHGLGLAINDRLRRAAAPRPSENLHQSLQSELS